MLFFAKTSLKPFDFKGIFANILSEWYYYVTFLAFVIIAVLLIFAFRKKQIIKLNKTHKIALIAVLSALNVVANAFSFSSKEIQLSLIDTVCFISGFTLGPIGGFTVGFVGDLIAGFMAPTGPYNAIIGLASALRGFIPGVIFGYFKGNDYLKATISFIITFVLCSLILNTIATYLMWFQGSKTYPTLAIYLSVRMLPVTLGVLVNFTICMLLIAPLRKIKTRLASRA